MQIVRMRIDGNTVMIQPVSYTEIMKKVLLGLISTFIVLVLYEL
jgi:hypothetical protein